MKFPQKLDTKSNFWGVFIMKFTYEDKIQIYELKNKDLATHSFQRCFMATIRNLNL